MDLYDRISGLTFDLPAGSEFELFSSDSGIDSWRSDTPLDRQEAARLVTKALKDYKLSGLWPVLVDDLDDHEPDLHLYELAAQVFMKPKVSEYRWRDISNELSRWNTGTNAPVFLYLVNTDQPYALLAAFNENFGELRSSPEAWVHRIAPLAGLDGGPVEIVGTLFLVAVPENPSTALTVSAFSDVLAAVGDLEGSCAYSPFDSDSKRLFSVAWDS